MRTLLWTLILTLIASAVGYGAYAFAAWDAEWYVTLSTWRMGERFGLLFTFSILVLFSWIIASAITHDQKKG